METVLPSWFEGDESFLGVLFARLGFVFDLGETFTFHRDHFVVEVTNHFLWLLFRKWALEVLDCYERLLDNTCLSGGGRCSRWSSSLSM